MTNYFAVLDEGSVCELARMLTFAYDESIAVAVIDQWLEQKTERPTPADLRQLVALHNEAREPKPEPAPVYECATCQDSGLLGGGDLGPEGKPLSACDCEKGRAVDPAELDKLNADWRRLRVLAHQPPVKRAGRPLNVGEIYRDV